MRAEARRRVDRVAERGVLQPAARPHHAHDSGSGVDADAPTDWRKSFGQQSLLQLVRAVDQVVGAADGKQRVVFLQPRGVPESHDLVADVLVDGAVPGEDDPAEVVEVHLHHLGDIARRHRLRHRGEAADVDEEERDVAALTPAQDVVDSATGLRQLVDDLGLQVVTEQSGDLALLTVLIKEPIRRDTGIGEGDGKPGMEQVRHPVVEGRECGHSKREQDQRADRSEETPQDRHTGHADAGRQAKEKEQDEKHPRRLGIHEARTRDGVAHRVEQHLDHVGVDLHAGHRERLIAAEAGRHQLLVVNAGQPVGADHDDLVLDLVGVEIAADDFVEAQVVVVDLEVPRRTGEVDQDRSGPVHGGTPCLAERRSPI